MYSLVFVSYLTKFHLRLHHFLKDSSNQLVVCGGVGNILFLNGNVASLEGGFDLAPEWVDGPYEAQVEKTAFAVASLMSLSLTLSVIQASIVNTPFEDLTVTLPGPGTSVTVRETAQLHDAKNPTKVWRTAFIVS